MLKYVNNAHNSRSMYEEFVEKNLFVINKII